MDFSLSDEQVLLRDSARAFLAEEWPSTELRRMLDPDEAAPAAKAFWDKVAGMGWPGLLVGEEHGGLGLGLFDLAVLMEEAGRRLIPGTLHASGVLGALTLEALGSGEARRRHLPGVAEGKLAATVGIYEAGCGWDVEQLPLAGDGSVIKRYVPEAAAADLVLFVRRTGGDCVELCTVDAPETENLRSMDLTRPLHSVRCETGSLEAIGSGSVDDLQAVLDKVAIALAAEMVGSAAQVLDMTISYVQERRQFGRPVGTFQAVQHAAAGMLVGIEKARTAALYAAAVADEQPGGLAEAASIAKAAANRACVQAAESGIQLHGGQGFTWEQDLHLHLKRAKASEFACGDTSWHLDRLARILGIA